LEKWGVYLERSGGGDGEMVGEFLRRCGRVVSGMEASSLGMNDRMREIEARAVEGVERKRNEVMGKASAIIGSLVGDVSGVGSGGKGSGGIAANELRDVVSRVMVAAGMDGWQDGREAGDRSGGVKKSRRSAKLANERLREVRKRKYAGGAVVRSGMDGSLVATVEKHDAAGGTAAGDESSRPARGGCAGVHATLAADKSYGTHFGGWCGSRLRAMGFKMNHVARALAVDKATAWRMISGYERYWSRQALAGMSKPEPCAEWLEALEDAVLRASGRTVEGGRAMRGANVKLNGNRDVGVEDEL
jgi:hypothetical protein